MDSVRQLVKSYKSTLTVQLLPVKFNQRCKGDENGVNKPNVELLATQPRFIQNTNVSSPIGPFLFFASFVTHWGAYRVQPHTTAPNRKLMSLR